ncbi:MAG TPA: type II toxin-antitoxin system RelE/ParE family toxin [Bryobacteraceae bacterium]|jgi:mRNA interferase RelE/StbE|nr:type II toxin-antitoxin system RelE/ParE family toxin [Bryobacteraceae bacterium]
MSLVARCGLSYRITAPKKEAALNSIRYRIEYGPAALDDLDALPAPRRAQILRKIERLQSGLHGNIKRLHRAEAMYRLRMGDYRVLFDVEGSVIIIRRLGDRKDIYD